MMVFTFEKKYFEFELRLWIFQNFFPSFWHWNFKSSGLAVYFIETLIKSTVFYMVYWSTWWSSFMKLKTLNLSWDFEYFRDFFSFLFLEFDGLAVYSYKILWNQRSSTWSTYWSTGWSSLLKRKTLNFSWDVEYFKDFLLLFYFEISNPTA